MNNHLEGVEETKFKFILGAKFSQFPLTRSYIGWMQKPKKKKRHFEPEYTNGRMQNQKKDNLDFLKKK